MAWGGSGARERGAGSQTVPAAAGALSLPTSHWLLSFLGPAWAHRGQPKWARPVQLDLLQDEEGRQRDRETETAWGGQEVGAWKKSQ